MILTLVVLGVNPLFLGGTNYINNLFKTFIKKVKRFNSVNSLYNWKPMRKSGLTPKTTKVRVIRYAIIQSPQWFLGLTHSSSEASKYK